MSKRKKTLILIDVILFFVFLGCDQLTKYLAVINLKGKEAISIIPNILELQYLENRGAAFGMLQNQKIFFVFISSVVLLCIMYIIYKIPDKKKYDWLNIFLIMIAAGAAGNNLIDRVRFDYVIDFIYLVVINFPIFNVADILVCVATFFLVILLLFVYKEEDLHFLTLKEKKISQYK